MLSVVTAVKLKSAYRFAVVGLFLSASVLGGSASKARDVNITKDIPYVDMHLNGKTVRIERSQDPTRRLPDSYAKTSRKCPPFCIHPLKVAPGIETVGELELLKFLKSHVEKGKGLLVDARLPAWYKKGTIPGAINIPFTVLAPRKNAEAGNKHLGTILRILGAKKHSNDQWDFSEALSLLLFCNGPWCDQSPRAIRYLVSAGYPANKLFYYRGGVQMWLLMGLNIETPTPDPVRRNTSQLSTLGAN